jgi:RHS repeat-associated protein
VQYEQDYSGGIEYRKTPATGTFRIEAIYHEEGRYFNLNVDASNTPSWRKEYALRDHLGNTRLMFADKDGDGMVEVTSNASTNEILQENHYYPFGLSYGSSHWMNDAARDNKYLYNGKEIQDDWSLNLYAYGARYFDAALGRFTGVDPIADQFPHVSEFNYAENEPVANIDLWGLQKYKPNIQRINKPGDVFSGKTIQNMKEGIKTAAVEFVSVIKDGANKLGNGLGNLIAGTMQEGKPASSDYQDAGGTIKGKGISILSSKEKNANGVLDTKEADGGVTSIIESGEILLPADGGGITGDAASKSTQFSKSAYSGGLFIDKLADLKNPKTSVGKAVDSICLYCSDKPHGLPYITFDAKRNPIDTIDPKKEKK